VKCNSVEIKDTTLGVAKEVLKWKNEEDYLQYEFQICKDCKQIYWQGNTSNNAKRHFKEYV